MQINNIIIFSLDKPNKPATQAQRDAIVSLFDAKPILGVYQGQVENSFMVDFKHLQAVKAIAKMFNQDCILVVSDGCRLVYLEDNRVEHIGSEFSPVPDVKGLDSYSFFDSNYYTVK